MTLIIYVEHESNYVVHSNVKLDSQQPQSLTWFEQ